MVLEAIAYKPVKEASQPELVNNNILVAVYKSSDYTSEAYNNTSAQLHIIVEKVNKRGQHYNRLG
jgi:hypothetical protein